MGRQLVLCVLLVCVAGCGTKGMRQWLERVTPREDDALARGLIDALLREDYGFLIENMDGRALGDTPEEGLIRLYQYVGHNDLRSVELVGCRVFSSGTRRQSSLTYQLEFPESWYTAGLVIGTNAGVRKAIGFQLKKWPASLAEINRFTLKGKGLVHYVVLLGAIGVPILILCTLIQCVRTRVKRKWLWIPFILIGIGSAQLNWTTGQLGLQPLSLHVPGAALARGGLYAPWILSVSFPLGAVLFQRKRRKLTAAVSSGLPKEPDGGRTRAAPLDDSPTTEIAE